MKMMRVSVSLFGVVGLVLAGVFISASFTTIPNTAKRALPIGYQGQLLVTSDADQVGGSYADGFVAAGRGAKDALTRLRMSPDGGVMVVGAVEVNNSVISWPRVIAVSPDGRYAYVAETRKPFTTPTESVENVWTDVPKGMGVAVVELSDPLKVVQQVPVGENPNALSLNFDGTLLAWTSKEAGAELVVAQLVDGLITTQHKHSVSGVNHDGNYAGVASVEFHPSQNTLAVNVNCRDLALLDVSVDGTAITETGRALSVAKLFSVARWTPDGRFVIVSDVGWGEGIVEETSLSPGALVSVRRDGATVVSRATVGLSPEGFDLAPDGKLAVTSNMRRTYLPTGFPFVLFGARDRPSLSVVKVDSTTGALTTIREEYGFDGELPEDVAFDETGGWLAVAIFHERYERDPKNGFVEFWRVDGDRLERTETRVPVARGAHTLKRIGRAP